MASLPTLLQPADPSINLPSTSLHLLPFHVSYSGPARIANYFPIISDNDNGSTSHSLYKSYFRGRMLVGVDVSLPEGYSGQVWKSNAPSVSSSSSSGNHHQKASTSKRSIIDNSTDHPSPVNYSASSPRRSPRKHASATSSTSSINASTSSNPSTTTTTMMKAKGKKKPPPKRQRFAMSPDISPVKETPISTESSMAFEEALDKAADLLTTKEEEKDNSISSEEVFVTSPAKKRARLEAADTVESKSKEEEDDVNVTFVAESTTSTLQAAGDTIMSTTVKLERAVTPPPPPSSSTVESTVPSTPMSASSILPINIISPQTPRTPRAFSSHNPNQIPTAEEGEDEMITDRERIHQRLISHIGKFDKITIWNPDIELDKGDDCYVKSLTEWTQLADLIHS